MIQMTNIQTAGNVTMSITKLLTDAGLKATSLGPVMVKGGNQIAERLAKEPNYTPTEPGETPGETGANELKTEPLPPQVAETLSFPEATKLSISAEKLDVKGKATIILAKHI